MKSEVKVKVIGSQKDSTGEEQRIELVTEGKYIEKNGKIYVVYEESEISGMEGSTTTLKLEKNQRASIRRYGNTNTEMIFEKGKTHSMAYETPYGLLDMAITTHRLEVKAESDRPKIRVHIQYRIKIMGLEDTMNTLEINVE